MTVLFDFNPPVIAHRGASAYAPENTMIAFVKAAQLGIKWIEFDVMQAACGEPIIFHDDLLDRTTNRRGDVNHYPYVDLRSLDAGSWFDTRFAGEKIPALKEVMEFLQTYKMFANVEIKSLTGKEAPLVKRVLAEMVAYPEMQNNILYSSFSVDALYLLRKNSPNCSLGLLLHEWEPSWEKICAELNCVSVHVNHEIMTLHAAEKIKSLGKKLLCYTVNDLARALELYSWGVDAVFSDVPDKIVAGLNKNASRSCIG